MATAEQLGKGGVDDAGRPIFIATEHTKYAPTEDRELTDQEQLAWKSFQLWRTTMRMERRDQIYQGVTNADFTNFNISYHILGTPYPVIDPNPFFVDCVKCVRWYEHCISAAAGLGYYYWIKSKASTRYIKTQPSSRMILCGGTWFLTEFCFLYRSVFRLTGYSPNDRECRKYGVLETKERLEQKKAMWEKYAAYKKEWSRRFDYHVYGIRPGENWNLFSACWIPAREPSFCKETNYPLRKNPFFLSATPLREMFASDSSHQYIPRDKYLPAIMARNEFQYLYRGPLDKDIY